MDSPLTGELYGVFCELFELFGERYREASTKHCILFLFGCNYFIDHGTDSGIVNGIYA